MEIALSASSLAAISMKANPRERPVVRSCMMFTDTTTPAWEKWSCKSFSVAVKVRLPTNNLADILTLVELVLVCLNWQTLGAFVGHANK